MASALPLKRKKDQGLTLFEMSAVLVIIGLIIGGIIVVQSLVNAAEIRAAAAQIREYNAAVHTFRTKYGYLPGDMHFQIASSLGMFSETAFGGGIGHQDGNGLIEGGHMPGSTLQHGEPLEFWRQLSESQLIDESLGRGQDAPLLNNTGSPGLNVRASTMAQLFPPSRLGHGNFIVAYGASGAHYFQITGLTFLDPDGVIAMRNQITPEEAQGIDSKIDDGMPETGGVRAMGGTTTLNTPAVPGANACVFTGGDMYNTRTADLADRRLCQLRVSFF
jgi:prepilin-type N-terminal cleavage/methylation domain-containing protein